MYIYIYRYVFTHHSHWHVCIYIYLHDYMYIWTLHMCVLCVVTNLQHHVHRLKNTHEFHVCHSMSWHTVSSSSSHIVTKVAYPVPMLSNEQLIHGHPGCISKLSSSCTGPWFLIHIVEIMSRAGNSATIFSGHRRRPRGGIEPGIRMVHDLLRHILWRNLIRWDPAGPSRTQPVILVVAHVFVTAQPI